MQPALSAPSESAGALSVDPSAPPSCEALSSASLVSSLCLLLAPQDFIRSLRVGILLHLCFHHSVRGKERNSRC